jgi:hypothetical protein
MSVLGKRDYKFKNIKIGGSKIHLSQIILKNGK